MISAVVPTLRGGARLRAHLPSVVASLEASGEPWEVVVVDDGGGESPALPPGARLLPLAENGGYGPAVNAGAAAARGEWLLVLNDDVELDRGAVSRLRAEFADPGLFAAVPAIRSALAACGDEGGKAGGFRAGWLEIRERPSRVSHATLYPVGCCFLCRRSAFLELGGYDPAYAPFFWEDVDLGWRAWRAGLACRHVPEATCDHEGSATLAERHTLEERARIAFRNAALFHLRTLQDPALRAASFGALAAHALFDVRPERRQGLADGLAAYARHGRRPATGVSDREILARVEAG